MPVLTDREDTDEQKEVQSHLCAIFSRRELTLSLISQLHHIVKAVQRHRGISMGLLAGNKVFEKEFQQLQKQLHKRIDVFEAFAAQSQNVIPTRDLENIKFAWQTICHGWQDDRLNDNFELHSHCIEQILVLTQALASTIESPLASGLPKAVAEGELQAGNDDADYPKNMKKIEILDFVCTQLPQMIEFMAKIRGVSTYCAALGDTDANLGRKLAYFIDCARSRNEKIRHCSSRLDTLSQGRFHSLGAINELETKFVYLLSLVQSSVLSEPRERASASQLFELATSIIDAYWRIVEEGLYVVRLIHTDELEDWMRE